jgi:hypothetical protein
MQFFCFDSVESLPTYPLDPSDLKPSNSRYDTQISVFGSKLQKKLQDANIFIVGFGALGCEFLKNLALMGVSCSNKGKLTITDDDIKKSPRIARSRATREANPLPSPPPPLPPCLRRAAVRAGPLDTTRGASKEGGGGASPLSPLLSRSGRRSAEFFFFVLGLGQRPATAVGQHSWRSGRGPSSAAAWCVAGGPCGVLASGGVGGAWALDPARERLQEAESGGAGGKHAWRRRRGGCARRPWSMRPAAFGSGAWS